MESGNGLSGNGVNVHGWSQPLYNQGLLARRISPLNSLIILQGYTTYNRRHFSTESKVSLMNRTSLFMTITTVKNNLKYNQRHCQFISEFCTHKQQRLWYLSVYITEKQASLRWDWSSRVRASERYRRTLFVALIRSLSWSGTLF